MKKPEDIFSEVISIAESHRVSTATAAEALVTRADALAEMALRDNKALEYATIASVITALYSDVSERVERACLSPEYAEALFVEIQEKADERSDYTGGI